MEKLKVYIIFSYIFIKFEEANFEDIYMNYTCHIIMYILQYNQSIVFLLRDIMKRPKHVPYLFFSIEKYNFTKFHNIFYENHNFPKILIINIHLKPPINMNYNLD